MVFGRSRVAQAKALMRYRNRRIAWVTAVHGHDFVEAPALSRKRERRENQREAKSFGFARDNVCERSDALCASAQDLR